MSLLDVWLRKTVDGASTGEADGGRGSSEVDDLFPTVLADFTAAGAPFPSFGAMYNRTRSTVWWTRLCFRARAQKEKLHAYLIRMAFPCTYLVYGN